MLRRVAATIPAGMAIASEIASAAAASSAVGPSAPSNIGRTGRPAVAGTGIVFEDGSSMNGDLVVLAEERIARSELAESAGLLIASDGGIAVGRDLATSVPGIWAIGDAASCDGLRLGLLLSAESSAMLCASGMLLGAWGGNQRPAMAA